MRITGSGSSAACRVLLPGDAGRIVSVTAYGRKIPFNESELETSRYAEFTVPLPGPAAVRLRFGGK